jgi:hypothetical protein
MNVEDFFEFCRTHPEERYEYLQGYAYRLMAGGDSNHSLTRWHSSTIYRSSDSQRGILIQGRRFPV